MHALYIRMQNPNRYYRTLKHRTIRENSVSTFLKHRTNGISRVRLGLGLGLGLGRCGNFKKLIGSFPVGAVF